MVYIGIDHGIRVFAVYLSLVDQAVEPLQLRINLSAGRHALLFSIIPFNCRLIVLPNCKSAIVSCDLAPCTDFLELRSPSLDDGPEALLRLVLILGAE